MEVKNYFDDNSISYSKLRNLSVGPAYFKKIQEEEQEDKEHFIIGSCVDILLTEPDKFWEKYALEFQEVCEKVPTGQMKEFVEHVSYAEKLLKFDNKTNSQYLEDKKYAYEQVGFKQASFEKILERYEVEGKEYFNWLNNKHDYNKSIKDKQIISNTQYSLITKIVESLKTNRFTRKYFEGTIGTKTDKHLQLEIYWEYKDEKCKSKLDLVVVDHENREIHPIDIKTTGNSVFSFDSSALKWRYDLQSSFYSSALYWLINKSNDEYWNKLKDYTIKPFKFIVESSKYPGMPLMYECSEKFLKGGIDGFDYQGRWYKGFIELINDYKWYRENNSWDYSKDIIEKEGIIKLSYD